jgi:hypothetical protein
MLIDILAAIAKEVECAKLELRRYYYRDGAPPKPRYRVLTLPRWRGAARRVLGATSLLFHSRERKFGLPPRLAPVQVCKRLGRGIQ